MTFNWTTFILEIINFLVLLFILKKLFYQPIKKIITARQQEVQQVMDGANTAKQASEALCQKYEHRLQDWEREKASKLAELAGEMQTTKQQQLAALKVVLQQEQAKAQAQLQQQLASLRQQQTQVAINDGIRFTTAFLKQFADANLENKILEFLLVNFAKFAAVNLAELKQALHDHKTEVMVQSAYPLTTEQQGKISALLDNLASDKNSVATHFSVNPELLAGLVISIGAVILQANLKTELQLFAEAKLHE